VKVLREIQDCIRNGKYEITIHADEEAQEDDVTIADIKNAILTGKIVKKYINDPRGIRYKISGKTLSGQELFLRIKDYYCLYARRRIKV
jgi:hypothetical protein